MPARSGSWRPSSGADRARSRPASTDPRCARAPRWHGARAPHRYSSSRARTGPSTRVADERERAQQPLPEHAVDRFVRSPPIRLHVLAASWGTAARVAQPSDACRRPRSGLWRRVADEHPRAVRRSDRRVADLPQRARRLESHVVRLCRRADRGRQDRSRHALRAGCRANARPSPAAPPSASSRSRWRSASVTVWSTCRSGSMTTSPHSSDQGLKNVATLFSVTTSPLSRGRYAVVMPSNRAVADLLLGVGRTASTKPGRARGSCICCSAMTMARRTEAIAVADGGHEVRRGPLQSCSGRAPRQPLSGAPGSGFLRS